MKKFLYLLLTSSIFFLLCIKPVFAKTQVFGAISTDTTWSLANSPYRVTGSILVNAGVTLTIESGVVVKIDAPIAISVQGTLNATNVTFTESVTDDGWAGISFNYSGADGSRMENCTISHAKGVGTYNAVIHLYSAAPVFTGCTISDCTAHRGFNVQNSSPEISGGSINGISGYGMYVFGDSEPNVTGNTIAGNGYGARISYNSLFSVNPIFSGNTYSDNSNGDLQVGGTISGDVTWNEASGTVYRSKNGISIQSGGSLTIDPGIIVELDASIDIGVQGTLNATNVTFTESVTDDGWAGISFNYSGVDGSRMENCTIRHAEGVGTYDAVIHLYSASPVFTGCTISDCTANRGFNVQNSSPEISDCSISGISSYGMYVLGDSLPIVTRSTFEDNDVGVRVSPNGDGFFRGNFFLDNGSFGFNNLATYTVNAEYSYWGDTGGPDDPSDDTADGGLFNPNSAGDSVSDNVDYDPWVGVLPVSNDGDKIPDKWEEDQFQSTSTVNDTSDHDQDGLLDVDEFAYGTNPKVKDTDGDGMPDGYEADQKFNPIQDDARMDADLDGFSNLREYLSMSDPRDDEDLPPFIADGDQDGDIDGVDLAGFIAEFSSGCQECLYDLNPDGVLNDVDAFLFSEDLGRVD